MPEIDFHFRFQKKKKICYIQLRGKNNDAKHSRKTANTGGNASLRNTRQFSRRAWCETKLNGVRNIGRRNVGAQRGELRVSRVCVCVCREIPVSFTTRLVYTGATELPWIGSRSRARRRARNRAWNCAEARKVHVRNGLTSAATSAMDRVQSARARAIRHSSFWLAPISPDAIAYHARRGAIGCSGPVALFFLSQQ